MIIGLFPELLAPGGVQRAGRHTAAVLSDYAQHRGASYQFLSLNDPVGLHHITVGRHCVAFRGFGHSKARFAVTAVRLIRQRQQLVLAAHPNLAPLALMAKLMTPNLQAIVIAYGVEVWTPLPAHRKWSMRYADHILAISNDTARKLMIEQGVSQDKIHHLSLALDPEFYQGAVRGDSYAFSSGLPTGRKVLTVGRLAADEQYKGVDTLIEATACLFPRFPDLHLVIIGDGDDRPRLEALAQRHGVAHRVWFLGHVDRPTLLAGYRECDVFALPSRGEGFGLVFLEAMAMGKPVIGGAHGGTPDIIEDGNTGFLVKHGDIDSLCRVLARLLADDGLRRNVGDRARQQVLSTYLFEHFAQRLTSILDEVCAS